MAQLMKRLIGENLEFHTNLADDLGKVSADANQFDQVLMNLAVNARDAMIGGGTLTVETSNVLLDDDYLSMHPHAARGPYVMLSVADTGTGMTAEVKNRVFEPFFTTKPKNQGTGLGLATVYGIVKQSGGEIDLHSEIDHGTVFKVYLPRVEATRSNPPEPAVPKDKRGSETILVVEDEKAVRNLVRRILESHGYKVLTATNGREGLAIGERCADDIHLVLTDVVMPKMSGRELSDRLAVIGPGIRTLFMSGYTDDAIVHHGVIEGMHFINKPFTATELLDKIRTVLRWQ